jgi:glycosyltransferase involved in cell wall biosynthesis
MDLVVKAPFNTRSGYGRVIDTFVKYLPENGVNPHYIALTGNIDKRHLPLLKPFTRDLYEQTKQLIVFPMSLDVDIRATMSALSCNRPRVVYTMHETTQMIGSVVELFNRTNGVIVPCFWNRDTFIRDGVICPIHVIPLGVDTTIFNYKPHSNKDFVFGCGNADFRKRLPEIIRCFCRAFNPSVRDVRLKVKISPLDHFSSFTDDRIEIIKENLSINQLAEWYWGIDVFVSAAYAEGWGLMQQESMACGRPIISPNYGGVKEFFDEKWGYPLAYTETIATGPYMGTGGFWADFHPDDLIEKMRWCYKNREDVHAKGKLASSIAKIYDEKYIVPRILEVLTTI